METLRELRNTKVTVAIKTEENGDYKKKYDELVEEFKKVTTTQTNMEEDEETKETDILKKRIENQNRNILDIRHRGQQIFNENTRFQEEVKHTQRYWNTIISRDDDIRSLKSKV